ncbi:MAG: flagellar basal body rod protein FlgC [Proteobacteria bacterium]|nr:flagellar basal body rod protein FlgC [Pseudomonadota bacterium]
MDLMKSLKVSASALSAHRTKVNVISENIANSETTRTENGGPYRRKMVVFKSKDVESNFKTAFDQAARKYSGVEVDEIVESQENFHLIYNPAHPDADPDTGYVKMPNVDTLSEMADMLVAKRSYDASVTVLQNTKSMIRRALTIGE